MNRDEREERGTSNNCSVKESCLERRQQLRYGVRTPVDFAWSAGGVSQRGQGITRDISTKGMFIYSDVEPPAQTDLEIEVAFNPLGEKGTNLQMTAKSIVLRVEPPASFGAPHGFAVLNKSYKLHSGSTLVEDQEWDEE